MAAQTWFDVSLTIGGTAVNDVVKVTLPELTVKELEYITCDQANEWFQKYAGPKNVGTLKCECNYSKANYAAIYAAFGDEATSFVFTGKETTPEVRTYTGFVSKIGEVSGGPTDTVTMTFEVTITGIPTFA